MRRAEGSRLWRSGVAGGVRAAEKAGSGSVDYSAGDAIVHIRMPDGKVADPKSNAPKDVLGRHGRSRRAKAKTANRYDATEDGRTYDDSFDQPRRPNLKGEFKVVALVKFYEGALPKRLHEAKSADTGGGTSFDHAGRTFGTAPDGS